MPATHGLTSDHWALMPRHFGDVYASSLAQSCCLPCWARPPLFPWLAHALTHTQATGYDDVRHRRHLTVAATAPSIASAAARRTHATCRGLAPLWQPRTASDVTMAATRPARRPSPPFAVACAPPQPSAFLSAERGAFKPEWLLAAQLFTHAVPVAYTHVPLVLVRKNGSADADYLSECYRQRHCQRLCWPSTVANRSLVAFGDAAAARRPHVAPAPDGQPFPSGCFTPCPPDREAKCISAFPQVVRAGVFHRGTRGP